MAKKYHYTLEPTWVARKQGCRTGYGKTPADAIKAIQKAERERAANILRQEQAVAKEKKRSREAFERDKASINDLNADIAARLLENERLKSLLATYKPNATDRLVLMSMIYFKTHDAHEALRMTEDARKQGGTKVLVEGGKEAADRISKEWPQWKAAFDKALNAEDLPPGSNYVMQVATK